MFTHARFNNALLIVLTALISVLPAAGLIAAQANPRTAPASEPQQGCGGVPGPPFFSCADSHTNLHRDADGY